MEKLVESNLLAGVCDLTTTELADDLVGGVLDSGTRSPWRWLARRARRR